MPLILEGLVTTRGANGDVNVAPMGPIVDRAMTRLVLRPYQTSTTYANLKVAAVGVLHVTDDVELLARAAVGRIESPPRLTLVPALKSDLREADAADAARVAECPVLADACRWYAFVVDSLDDSQERTEIVCRVVAAGRLRDFFGWNRAAHAVVEGAILATRVSFLPPETIRSEFERLATMVEKTAGPEEERAFAFLRQYVDNAIAPPA
jgi:uncharacterized protein